MPRTEWIPSLVCTVDRLCAGLWRIALVENDFVVSVACRHGYSLPAERFAMRPGALPLYGAIFHPLRCYFPPLWPRASSARTFRVEVDRRRDNHWRLGPLLRSGAVSRALSAKTLPPNQTMKPTPKPFASRLAPWGNEFSVFATPPCHGLSVSR